MNYIEFILSELQFISKSDYLKKMAHFEIDISMAFGIRVPNIRKLGKPDFTKPVF